MRRTAFLFCIAWVFFSSGAFANTGEREGAADLSCAKKQSELTEATSSRQLKRDQSLAGISCAERCLAIHPEMAACHYYRAVNRGHLIESGLVTPKKHIPLMVADFRKASEIDPRYDGAGALRALGYVYLKLPDLPVLGRDLTRDLDLATGYAGKAMAAARDEAENFQLAGEVAFTKSDYVAALDYFKDSLKLLKRSDLSEVKKQQIAPQLKTWIRKSKKKLRGRR